MIPGSVATRRVVISGIASTSTPHPVAAFREAGAGTGVVCLHSSASSSGQWRPFMDRIASRFHVVAADLYGYGESPRWPGEHGMTLDDEIALLEAAFHAAGPRFHLVGHSYGAAVALKVALARPDSVLSLSLYEPVLFSLLFEEDPEQAASREVASLRDDTSAALASGRPEQAAERFIDYWMNAGTWAKTPEKRRQGIVKTIGKIKDEWHALLTEQALLGAFSALDVETLLMVGSASPASSRGIARLLIGALPRVTAVHIDGAGHMGPITHADRINDAFEAHLAAFAPG